MIDGGERVQGGALGLSIPMCLCTLQMDSIADIRTLGQASVCLTRKRKATDLNLKLVPCCGPP